MPYNPRSATELIDYLQDKDPVDDTLNLRCKGDWTLSDLQEILRAARHNKAVHDLTIYLDHLDRNKAGMLAEMVSCFDSLRKFSVLRDGHLDPAVSPAIIDCLLRGAARSRTHALREVNLGYEYEGGSDAVIELFVRFPDIEVLCVYSLSDEAFAHSLALGFSNLKKLKELTLAGIGSVLAWSQLLPTIPLSPLEDLKVSTSDSLSAVDAASVFKSLKVLRQCIPTLKKCFVGGQCLADIRHFLDDARLSPCMEELSIWGLTLLIPDPDSFTLPSRNTTLKKLKLDCIIFLENSLSALLQYFEGVTHLSVNDCQGTCLSRPQCWTDLLQNLTSLEIDGRDYHHLRNDVVRAIAAVISKTSLTTLCLELAWYDYPALQDLVRNCRGALMVTAVCWATVNMSFLCSGLMTNQGIEDLRIYFEDCEHTNEEYCSLFHAVRDNSGIKSFELAISCDPVFIEEDSIELDEACGAAVGDLLEAGILRSLSLQGSRLCLSNGFVQNMSSGLANAASLASLELSRAEFNGGSLPYLSAALQATRSPLERLSISQGQVPDFRSMFRALPHLRHLQELSIDAEVLPNDHDTANLLVETVRRHPPLQKVNVGFPAALKAKKSLMNFYLKVNRSVRRFQDVLAAPVPLGLWPFILAQTTGHEPQDGPRVEQAHVLFHYFLRHRLPSLVGQQGEQ